MNISFLGSKEFSFKTIKVAKKTDTHTSDDYLIVDAKNISHKTNAIKVFYGNFSSSDAIKNAHLTVVNTDKIDYYFSTDTQESEIVDFLKKESLLTKNRTSKSYSTYKEDEKKDLSFEEIFKNEIEKNTLEVQSLKEGSIEKKGLREYVVRLLSVNTLEQMVYETERLRVLRYKGIKLSLIYIDDNSGFLCTKKTLTRIDSKKFKRLINLKNDKAKIAKNLADILFRPVLSHYEIKSHDLNKSERIYVLFESDTKFESQSFFFKMLFKLLITNLIRVLQTEKLSKISSLLSSAFGQIKDISILVGRDHEIKVSNRKESVGQKCYKYIFEKDSPCNRCPLNNETDENVSVELKDNNYIVHSSNLSHFNSLDRLHIYESKLTSKKRDSLKIQRGKLQSLGIVTTALTHELNNPLTGIYELSNELKQQFEGQVQEDFDEVSKASKRCLSIIENLNNFSSKKIDFERIKLQKVIEDAFLLTKILVQRVKIHCSFEPDVWISGSSTIISQAVFNVLKNSIEAMDNKGEIFISLFKQNGSAILSFEDRGPGFPENFNQIELFGTSQKAEGVGYGMFLIHEFVKLHGGDLSFGNNTNEAGAYFTMRFPLEQA